MFKNPEVGDPKDIRVLASLIPKLEYAKMALGTAQSYVLLPHGQRLENPAAVVVFWLDPASFQINAI